MLLKLAAGGIAFGFHVILARALGATGMGTFVLAVTLVSITTVFSRFGLDNVLLRGTAAGTATQNWSTVLGLYRRAMQLAMVLAVVCTILLWLTASWLANGLFGKPELAVPLQWMALAVFPTTLLMLHSELLKGLKRVASALSVQSLLIPLLGLVGLWFIPADKLDVKTVVWVYTAASLLTAVTSYSIWHAAVRGRAELVDGPPLGELLHNCLPLFGVTLMAGVVIPSAPVIFLGVWGNSSEVGIFGVASRVAMLTSLVLIAVNSIAAPKFAAFHHQADQKNLGETARQAARLTTLLAAPVLLFFVIVPDWILQLFGNEFAQGVLILVILAVGEFVNVATGPVGYLLTMSGHDRQLWASTILSATVNVGLCLALIPVHGAIGAAIAAATSVVVNNITNVYLVWRHLGIMTISLPLFPRFATIGQK